MIIQTSFFDLDNRYRQLSLKKDRLELLNRCIDWGLFLPDLDTLEKQDRKSRAGRKPTDRVLLFKMLILQRLYNISDDALEYAVCDRISFMRFLDLGLAGNVPDAKTVWLFRESLKKADLVDVLFDRFMGVLNDLGLEVKSGQMVDATFVPCPIQRNTWEENNDIKEGKTPAHWESTPNKLRQKDVDARWTKKGEESHYGYKNNINVDKETKLITNSIVTPASVHDSQSRDSVLRPPHEGGKDVYADSAYKSEECDSAMALGGYNSHIHERAYRNKPLSAAQKASNTAKSRIRARVEHVFGAMENEMGGIYIRSIGIARAKVNITLTNLAYNIKRVEFLIRSQFTSIQRVSPSNAGGFA